MAGLILTDYEKKRLSSPNFNSIKVKLKNL